MVTTKAKKRPRPTMTPEVKQAYAQVESGIRGIGKSITEIQQGLRKAERKIEADARARIKALRADARAHLPALQARRREVARTLGHLATAAEGSWHDVKQSADSLLADARVTAASVIERFRKALAS